MSYASKCFDEGKKAGAVAELEKLLEKRVYNEREFVELIKKRFETLKKEL